MEKIIGRQEEFAKLSRFMTCANIIHSAKKANPQADTTAEERANLDSLGIDR